MAVVDGTVTARHPERCPVSLAAAPRRAARQRRPSPARLLASGLLAIGLSSLARAECEPAADAPGGETSPLPQPALNHLYVVLDAETFAALRDGPWVERALATPDVGLPHFRRPTRDSDRLFLRGRNTYLEFFGPDNRFGEPVGKVGMALGLDAPAGLKAVEQAWRGAYGADVRHTEVTFSRTDPPVPWYDALQVDATSNNPHLVVWAMTYRPEFVSWLSGDAGAGARTSRSDALVRRWKENQNFQDIVGLALAVPRPLHDTVVQQLQHAGMRRDGRAAHTRLNGDGWYLAVQAHDSSASGLEYIEFHVAGRTEAGCGFRIGNSTVEVEHADRMRWRFGRQETEALPGCRR